MPPSGYPRSMPTPLQDHPPFAGHSPDQERPLGGYAALMATFSVLSGGFALWFARSGRRLPERIGARDIALMSVATHKSSRLVTKDRVSAAVRAPFTTFEDDAGPGEVDEWARGHGLRLALGELLVCPYCLAMWISTALTAGLLTVPRTTRVIATVFTVLSVSDALQLAYLRAEQTAAG